VPYNVDPARVRLTPGAGKALRALAEGGYRPFVVSNQSGVARGYFTEGDLRAVEARLGELLAPHGVAIEAYRYCFHHPQGTVAAYRAACDCRKPAPGMILELAREHGLDLARSWMVGDGEGDVAAGRAAGCRTVLIVKNADPEEGSAPGPLPDVLASDLDEAARAILAAG